jgi:hypothetical protein
MNEINSKKCPICDKEKPLNDFYKGKNYKLGVRSYCKECEIKNAKLWTNKNLEKSKLSKKAYYSSHKKQELNRAKKRRKEHPEIFKKWREEHRYYTKNWHLKKNYGITLVQYNEMLIAQNGTCIICKREEIDKNKSLAVDHDHQTGKVRGLLCRRCNTVLGLLNENPEIFNTFINYLK